MAKDAIEAVREAELKAKEILEEAKITRKNSRIEAEKSAENQFNKVLSEAEAESNSIKDKALSEGELMAKPIIQKGLEEAEAINGLKGVKLESAVNIIIERIVNANGNS
ncbi:hypothetical protein E9840_10360 [Tissierella creatinini]|nr:hypothetical protein E9840_10360 [Tissierella creatinini]TJX64563.1 hypothetical protein E8P77_11985 [Soehngenia saccharolytica]